MLIGLQNRFTGPVWCCDSGNSNKNKTLEQQQQQQNNQNKRERERVIVIALASRSHSPSNRASHVDSPFRARLRTRLRVGPPFSARLAFALAFESTHLRARLRGLAFTDSRSPSRLPSRTRLALTRCSVRDSPSAISYANFVCFQENQKKNALHNQQQLGLVI